jgi:catechol 2,3-dioxygenase-like lactoylglutathione lyase family enzyme
MWWGIAVDAPDPLALATFYSGLLGWPVVGEDNGSLVVAAPEGRVYLVLQPASEYEPPTWPPRAGSQRPMMHLDFQVGDLDVAVAEAVARGARLADEQPNATVRVLLDPAGHPFCLSAND